MYSFYPKKEYNIAWGQVVSHDPTVRADAVRHPGWFGNEVVVFNHHAEPYFFWKTFRQIGEVQRLSMPGCVANKPKKQVPEAKQPFMFLLPKPYPNRVEFSKLCQQYGCAYRQTAPRTWSVVAPSLKHLADLAVAYGYSLPPDCKSTPNLPTTQKPDFYQRFRS